MNQNQNLIQIQATWCSFEGKISDVETEIYINWKGGTMTTISPPPYVPSASLDLQMTGYNLKLGVVSCFFSF